MAKGDKVVKIDGFKKTILIKHKNGIEVSLCVYENGDVLIHSSSDCNRVAFGECCTTWKVTEISGLHEGVYVVEKAN